MSRIWEGERWRERGGAGQFGSVYKAVRAGVQDCAVKLLHRTSAEDLSKFIEARFAQPRGCVRPGCCAAWSGRLHLPAVPFSCCCWAGLLWHAA